MKKLLLGCMFALGIGASAQINYSYGWEPSGMGGWTTSGNGEFSRSTTTPCSGSASARTNNYYANPSYLVSPVLTGNNGGDLTVSFAYKVTKYNSNSTGAAAADFGTIKLQWSNSLTGSWTDAYTITSSDHTVSASCATKTASITGLPSSGDIYLRFVAQSALSSSDNYVYFDDISVTQGTPPSCMTPSLITLSGISTSGAEASWPTPATVPANGYQVYYSTSSTVPTPGITLDTTNSVASTSTTTTINGLNSSTVYYVWVRSSCGAGNYSSWSPMSTFTTLCVAVNVPYLQDFESVTTPALPICTSIENAGTGNNWKTASAPGGDFNTKVLNYSYNTTNPANAWFFTQGVNLTAGASYRIKYIYGNAAGTTVYPEKLKVAYGTSPASSAMNTVLADHPNIVNQTTSIESVVDFTPATTGVYYFGFNAYSATDMNQLYVDNIHIDLTPTCIEPAAVTTSNPQFNSIDVSWTAPATAPANGYEVYYSTTNTAPTAGTILNSANSVTSNTTSATINGLTSATTYFVWVRSACSSSEKSYWTGPASITTVCTSVNVPYMEDFENVTLPALPNCTTAENLGTGNQWETINYPNYGFTSNSLAYHWHTSNPANTWFYTRGLNLTAGTQYKLTFRYGGTGTSFPENMKVAYGTSAAAAGMTTQLADYPNITISAPSTETIVFTPATTGVYYIGFNCYSGINKFYLFLDDISVTENVLATNEATAAKSAKVYPNPFKDILNISDVDNIKTITVMDVSGRVVKTIEKVSSSLNLSDLKEGLYLVNLNYKDGKSTSVKVIKK